MRAIETRRYHDRPTCLVCDRNVHARGLCESHYHQCRYLIREGLETWESLEKSGRARPPSTPRYSKTKRERVREAVVALHRRGVYPSSAAVGFCMGRMSCTLRGDELVIRREIFKELGIEVRHRGKAPFPPDA